jgi:hypothetical protein
VNRPLKAATLALLACCAGLAVAGCAGSTPPAAGNPTTTTATIGTPTVVDLPATAQEKWKAVGSPIQRAVAGHDIGENECASIDGASGWVQQGYAAGTGPDAAIRDTFTFADAAAAQSALRTVASAMASCQQTSRAGQTAGKITPDATVTQTAALAQAGAWRRSWTGVRGLSAYGPQINHYYAAAGGNELIFVQFTEFPGAAAPYDTAADPQVLATLDRAVDQ